MPVPSPSLPSLQQYLSNLALDVVAFQQRLDATYESDLIDAEPVVEAAATTGLLQRKDLLPLRQLARRSTIQLNLKMQRTREASGGLSVGLSLTPVNLSYQARFAERAATASQLTMEVIAVPAPPNVSMKNKE